jgi:TPR repeat protein
MERGKTKTMADFLLPKAEKGDAKAQFSLGMIHHLGQGVPKDPTEAAKWLTLAAGGGNSGAQYLLGTLHLAGQGVEENARTAVRWFSEAAKKLHAPSQYQLGLLYLDGKGNVAPDMGRALRWLREAALDLKYPEAQFSLGMLHAEGRGVERDPARARELLNKAANHGIDKAREWLEAND